MRNLLIFTLLAGFSLGALADHHGGDQDGKTRHHKGMFKHADKDGDGAVSTEEHEQAWRNGRQTPQSVSRKWTRW